MLLVVEPFLARSLRRYDLYLCAAFWMLPRSAIPMLVGAMPPVPEDVGHSSLLAGLPVFIAHGSRDEIIPVSAAQHTRDAYSELGADVTYGEYSTAHKVNAQAMKDLKAWLAKLFPAR